MSELNMELKGKVILDENSMDKLKEKIREEVIEEILTEGNYVEEIEKYLLDCDFQGYVNIIESTIDSIILKTNIDEIHFAYEKTLYNKILAIQSIFRI